MAKMKSVQVPRPGGDFEIVELEIPEPGPGHVRIRLLACGVCHSDVVTKEGLFPGKRRALEVTKERLEERVQGCWYQ